jgi:hypothetical protein
LTATVGNISPGSAILKLAARGLSIPPKFLEPDQIDRHIARIDRRKRNNAFWSAARLSTDNTGNTGPAQRKLGILPGAMLKPEWSRRGGRFVGHCTLRDADALLRPGLLDYRAKTNRTTIGGTGWRPIFVGYNWKDLLVIAYHSLPGQLSGFLFIGREARWPEDFVFATCHGISRAWAVGVAMFEAAMPLHKEFGDTVFVLEDPVLAVRTQLRHLMSTDTPLPLVGAWGSHESKSIWSSLPRRNLVHWTPTHDDRVITRARLSGGRVALAPTSQAIAGHLERSRPVLALRNMLGAARPWDAALEALLSQLAPAKAEELVLNLKLRPDETSGFLRACADDTRARLSGLFMDAGRPRGVTISGKMVIEAGGAWRVARSGELVCDAVLRIEQVIRSATGAVSYRGRIEYKGQTLPFCVPDSEIERDTLRWIKRKVGQAGLGEVVIGSIFWSKHMLTIAQQLEPPRSVRGLSSVGWDDTCNAFTLPQFILRGNGEIMAPDYVVPLETVLPAAGLAAPESLTPGARVALAWGTESNQLFWATAACLLADILAPAIGFPRTSTALVGAGATTAGIATAIAFGCPAVTTLDDHGCILSASVHRMLSSHRWPVMVRRSFESATVALGSRALVQLPAGSIAVAGALAGRSLGLTNGWNVITCDQSAVTDRIAEHGGTILRAYLKDLCERRLYLEVNHGLLEAVHKDLVAWYSQFSASRAISGSWHYICPDAPDEHHNRFGRLISYMIDNGDLYLAPPTNQRFARQAIVLLGGDRACIPKVTVNEILTRNQAIALDTGAISTQLRKAGVLFEEQDQDYIARWVVPESWLRQHMEDYRRENRAEFSVVK